MSSIMQAEGTADVSPVGPRSYLLVFQGDSSAMVPLPASGEILVGRDTTADLHLDDTEVAPQQVRLVLAGGEATLVNLAARGSTHINGESLTGARVLTSGDTIEVGSATLVFHHGLLGHAKRTVLDPFMMRQRLREETERSLRYARPLAVLAIHVGVCGADKLRRIRECVLSNVRAVDVVAWDGTGEFILILPDTGESAVIPSVRLMQALAQLTPDAHAGLALCPTDARDADALLTGCRAACRNAPPGELNLLSSSATLLRIRDRLVLAVDTKMRRVMGLVERLAASDMPVLITGETGVGKEVVAAALHAQSSRADKPMVTINCAAIAESLFESELFGHERGAFTGAVSGKPGLMESAAGGTVFLDEIGECSPQAQAKLLRAIETKRISRVGSVVEHPIDVRIVAATNRSLEEEVKAGRFRQDLFFRLSAATVIVPPLRERPLDLPVLARTFLEQACARLSRTPFVIAPDTMHRLELYAWPGNVRELKNLMDYLAATVDGPVLRVQHLPDRVAAAVPWMKQRPVQEGAGSNGNGNGHRAHAGEPPQTAASAHKSFRNIYEEIRELERLRIEEALTATGGVRIRAAELIGMPLRTLVAKLKEYHITMPPPRGLKKPSDPEGG